MRVPFNTDPFIVTTRSPRHPGIASSTTNFVNAAAAYPTSSHARHCGENAGNEDGAAARWRSSGSDNSYEILRTLGLSDLQLD